MWWVMLRSSVGCKLQVINKGVYPLPELMQVVPPKE